MGAAASQTPQTQQAAELISVISNAAHVVKSGLKLDIKQRS